jgi:hypothetical protein
MALGARPRHSGRNAWPAPPLLKGMETTMEVVRWVLLLAGWSAGGS